MAGVLPEFNIDGPEASAPVHSLLRCALKPTVTFRWPGGFKFRPDNCPDISTWDPHCPDAPPEDEEDPPFIPGAGVLKTAAGPNQDWELYLPFMAETVYQCDSTGWTAEDDGAALRQLEAGTAKALGYEFWTGELKPTNRHLASPAADDVTPAPGDPTSIYFSLGAMVQALANCGGGGRGMIHTTPFLAQSWAAAGALIVDPPTGCLMTIVGHHIVIPDPGYPGTGPNGELPPDGATWVYATGMVQALIGDPKILKPDSLLVTGTVGDVHGVINSREVRAERDLAAWWGCCHSAVLSQVC